MVSPTAKAKAVGRLVPKEPLPKRLPAEIAKQVGTILRIVRNDFPIPIVHPYPRANYSLRKAATDNESKCGKQAAEVLHRNFY
ncbi:MAG: hypothetical protein AAF591_19755, partial [Verrucomicrobiota bacterium]